MKEVNESKSQYQKHIQELEAYQIELKLQHEDFCMISTADLPQQNTAEMTLVESKDLYTDLVANQSVGIYRILVQNKDIEKPVEELISMEFVSDRFCELLEIQNADLLAAINPQVFKKIHPDDAAYFIKSNEDAQQSQQPYVWEGRFLLIAGIRWIRFESGPRKLPNGSTRWTGVVFDITEQKVAEEALRKSEKKYRQLYESIMDAVGFVDMKGRIIDSNSAFQQMLGYPASELQTLNYRDLTPEKWLDFEADIISNQVMKRGFSATYEKEYRRKDGTVFPIEIRSFLLKNDENRPYGIWAIIRDITERKLAEMALQNANWKLISIIEGMHVGTWEWNIQTGETVFNEIWAQIIGYTLDELGKIDINTWKSLTHPDDLKQSGELLELHFSGELPIYDFECRMRHKSGHWIWVHDRGRVINFTSEGKPLMMFGTHTDITRRKHDETEIKHKNKELLKINAEKDKYLSIIAHDLRSPFSGFLGLTELMAEGLHKMTLDEIQNIAVLMRNSATNLFRLLGNLLEWSRMQRGLIAFAPVSFLLEPKISEIMVIMLEAAMKKEITISYAIPKYLSVYADVDMFAGIIRNLVSNAVKFSCKGGVITIMAKSLPNNSVEISIKDTGIGMNKVMITNLFRLDVNTNRKGTEGECSTGLGLIICKDFVRKHGGKLWIESEVGIGSTFHFTLPDCLPHFEVN